jgi:hypothetical protein
VTGKVGRNLCDEPGTFVKISTYRAIKNNEFCLGMSIHGIGECCLTSVIRVD